MSLLSNKQILRKLYLANTRALLIKSNSLTKCKRKKKTKKKHTKEKKRKRENVQICLEVINTQCQQHSICSHTLRISSRE
uniref:Uncharacterized protein n=1 Tax=Nelumbo nucifera TaxID=4432 RepID=A0A822XL24_NELNU|nr:TPA_asm: hypothetical protein HUJ06_021886 [Nelumbo nucifera]